jgi:membrane protein implicated in regulation of membrane protease activity
MHQEVLTKRVDMGNPNLCKGELWTAVSEEDRIEPDDPVIIKKIEGLKLFITKK